MVTTTFDFDGYKIVEYKGLVRGIIVRAPTIAQGIVGGLKNIIGGRIGAYTEMCEQARQQAYDSLLIHAQQMGANAIVGVRYDASEVVSKGSATEVLCYGTAVVVTKI
ncbi:YbjQ family protein [Pedosphaera parvula]|nr:YbjQ family protein [Pedosphaera parvula]